MGKSNEVTCQTCDHTKDCDHTTCGMFGSWSPIGSNKKQIKKKVEYETTAADDYLDWQMGTFYGGY